MAAAMAAPAVGQSLLQPNRLLLPSIPRYSSSRSRHFPSLSSILNFKNHDCNGSSSSLCSFSTSPSLLHLHQRFKPVSAIGPELPHPIQPSAEAVNINRNDGTLNQWDGWTAKFAAAANIPFLLLQLPQIWLNACNLMSGNYSALLAVNWLGSLTGLLGNLSLLSYFAKKRETEAMIVQCLGVVTTYAIVSQLAIAEAMPSLYFTLTSVVVGVGVISNFLNYFGMLPSPIWGIWEDFITVGGLSVLPQVMWSTFVPYIPNSMLPGTISFVLAVIAAFMARTGRLSAEGVKFYGAIAGWTATLLFMWMPVPQLWTNFLNPENIKGLSSLTMLLAMTGNGLMIPRALFTRDFMWFLGSSWASFLYGWGNLLCMYLFNSISREYFFAITAGLFIWTGFTFWKDSNAYGHSSPLRSFKELLFGS
ncbi:Maltose excess protein 1 chloroplastic [Bienertia sinuspersici]